MHAVVVCLLTISVTVMWVVEPLYSSYAIDALFEAVEGRTPEYVFLFATWGAVFVVYSVVQGVHRHATWGFINVFYVEQRERIYRRILTLGLAFHTQQKAGEVIKRLDDGAEQTWEMLRMFLVDLIPSALSAVAFIVISFFIEPVLACIMLAVLALYMLVAYSGNHITEKVQNRINDLWVAGIGRAFDAATNIVSVQSGAQEAREEKRMHRFNREALGHQWELNRLWATLDAINFPMLTRILLAGIGVVMLASGRLSLGELYYFQFTFFRILVPFEILGNLLPQWGGKMGKIRLAEQVATLPDDVVDAPKPVVLKKLGGSITFANVTFAYRPVPEYVLTRDKSLAEADTPDAQRGPPGSTLRDLSPAAAAEPDVLRGIDLDIRAGEHLALVGHSGAGKSTMAMLLNRFYDPTGGTILVDGTDMRLLDKKWWRSRIGLVLQDNLMFNDSILENIRYARPTASRNDVIAAAKRACAHQFISKLPKGYDTLVGDRGIRLSGGERQRVAIARAILKKPDIVILDEATSALDSMTEKAVQDGIKELIKGRTAIIIAHRLSTVRAVDRIAVMEKGKVIACAPHDELLKTCKIYKEMVELQQGGVLAEE